MFLNKFIASILLILIFTLIKAEASAQNADKIDNYIEYSKIFSSSGQPDKEQLKILSKNNFKQIIYLAFTDQSTSLDNEDRIVKSLGMDYVHIPVDFDNPKITDFNRFAAIMNSQPEKKTLLHCQINLRASTFSFLYRVIHKNIPMKTAKDDLDKIWEPNPVWFKFIKSVLANYDMTTECDGCDWGANEFDT